MKILVLPMCAARISYSSWPDRGLWLAYQLFTSSLKVAIYAAHSLYFVSDANKASSTIINRFNTALSIKSYRHGTAQPGTSVSHYAQHLRSNGLLAFTLIHSSSLIYGPDNEYRVRKKDAGIYKAASKSALKKAASYAEALRKKQAAATQRADKEAEEQTALLAALEQAKSSEPRNLLLAVM